MSVRFSSPGNAVQGSTTSNGRLMKRYIGDVEHSIQLRGSTDGRRSNLETAIHLPACPHSHSGNVMIQTPLLPDALETSHQPAYNIKRRTYNESLLLQSPVRQGHHDRMRRIFEDAGQTVSLSHSKKKLGHPRVLDTSQHALPQQTQQRNSDISISVKEPPRPCGRAILGIENLHSEPTEHTVDSWSDDSGYLYTESQIRLRAVGPSAQRIQQWLSNVALTPLVHAERDPSRSDVDVSSNTRPSLQAPNDNPHSPFEFRNPAYSQRGSHCSVRQESSSYQARQRPSQLPQYSAVSENECSIHRPHTHVAKSSSKHDNILSPRGANREFPPAKPTQHGHNHGTSFHSLTDLASMEDPFVAQDSEHLSLQRFIPSITSNVRKRPEIKTSTPILETFAADEREPELIPLSPNVCIERRRKNHRRSLAASPYKAHHRSTASGDAFGADHGKENLSAQASRKTGTLHYVPD